MSVIEIPVIRARQNIGELYVGVMNARDLFDIAEVDRIRLESLKVPKYAGFQRALVEERVEDIRDYLNTPRSTFPNAIILSIDSEHIVGWGDNSNGEGVTTLKLQREPGVATIIDGQHRAAALDGASKDFQVVVSIFIDLEMRQKAEIFAKINSTQKAVNPSIAFQLFGYAEDRSPQRTAHEIAETLNTTEGSPFYTRLRMLGSKGDWALRTLSQATFAKGLMRLYTRDPLRDENRLLRGEELEDYANYPLRQYFVAGEDRRILEIVWKFFFHVAQTWPDQWFDETAQSILPKTTGFLGLIEVLRKWLLGPRREDVIRDRGIREAFHRVKERYTTRDRAFVRDNYPPGQSGVQKLRDVLVEDLDLA